MWCHKINKKIIKIFFIVQKLKTNYYRLLYFLYMDSIKNRTKKNDRIAAPQKKL